MKQMIYSDKGINKFERVVQLVLVILIVSLILVVYLMTQNLILTLIVSGIGAAILVILFLYQLVHEKYMSHVFVQLSDLLDTIINMRAQPIFSSTEDTILSKLQFQTIKLTTILQAKNKTIEQDRQEIKALISDIAHQLKTPLTNLKMYGEFLNDETLSIEERQEFSDVMMTSLNRLTFLVESMIKMSRLESGVIQLRAQQSSLNETVLMAIAQIEKKAISKQIDIKLQQLSEVELMFDKNWIFEAVLNVLDNAVKYTSKGGCIEVTLQRYDLFSRIDISDNGIGIKAEEFPLIFKRFSRGTNIGEIEGIGIGLYLTNDIVVKHGGYMKVKSDEFGTLFSIFLPNEGSAFKK